MEEMLLTITTDGDEGRESDNDMMDEDDQKLGLYNNYLLRLTQLTPQVQTFSSLTPAFWKLYYPYSNAPNIPATRLSNTFSCLLKLFNASFDSLHYEITYPTLSCISL